MDHLLGFVCRQIDICYAVGNHHLHSKPRRCWAFWRLSAVLNKAFMWRQVVGRRCGPALFIALGDHVRGVPRGRGMGAGRRRRGIDMGVAWHAHARQGAGEGLSEAAAWRAANAGTTGGGKTCATTVSLNLSPYRLSTLPLFLFSTIFLFYCLLSPVAHHTLVAACGSSKPDGTAALSLQNRLLWHYFPVGRRRLCMPGA